MKLEKSKVQEALNILAKDAIVWVPMKVNGISRFAVWGSEGELDLDSINTMMPPKDALFPQKQDMYKYTLPTPTDVTIEEVVEEPK